MLEWLGLTFVELPSPLNEPPKSLTTTLAPRDPKNVAYAFPRPPPAPVTTTTWPSNLSWPAIFESSESVKQAGKLITDRIQNGKRGLRVQVKCG